LFIRIPFNTRFTAEFPVKIKNLKKQNLSYISAHIRLPCDDFRPHFTIKTLDMRRSKYGYLLLALLVITGLAGTITSTSITGKERKLVVSYLKDTKNDVLKSLKGLSKSQLNFKPSGCKFSIKECIYHAAVLEKNLWELMQCTLEQPANPDKRPEIKWSDEKLLQAADNCTQEEFELKKNSFKTVEEALESFKITRAEHFKYMKGTTEDLRNHIAQTAHGWLDCYQLCLLISSYSKHYLQQIEEIKADPNFPSR
jgi:hypothetical protein